MQAFLPYPSFVESAQVLDWRRLGKQRVEAQQMIHALSGRHVRKAPKAHERGCPLTRDAAAHPHRCTCPVVRAERGWQHHSATRMWEGYLPALILYRDVVIAEWLRRGYTNTLPRTLPAKEIVLPPWFGDERVHASHRANLLRKDPEYYGQFGWMEDPSMPYFWPGKEYLRE